MKIFKEYLHLPREVYVLVVAKTINGLGNFIMPLLTLILTEKVGLNGSQAGFYMLMLNVCFVPGLLFGGRLADSLGRKKVIIIFHSLAALVFMACGFIKPSMLVVYLLMLGSSFLAASLPAYDALLADLTNEHNRKRAFSLTFMGHNLGFSIAPVLGGFLFRNYLYLVFIIDAISTVISVILVAIYIPNMEYNQSKAKNEVREEKSQEKNLNVFQFLLNNKYILIFSGILFFYNFAFSQLAFTLPIHVVQLFPENGPKYYGTMEGLNGVLILILTPIMTRLTIKSRPTKAIAMGGILYTLTFALLIFVGPLSMFYLAILVMTFGETMITVNNNAFISGMTPPPYRGRVSGIFQIIYGAGFAIGPFIMGILLDYISIHEVWATITIIMALASLFMLSLTRRMRRKKIEGHY
ncbi:MAG: MFS transporter [Clostridia bacterium]|jgi:MFS family permease|nr:MFS transporter [Clostridia bacterium]